MGIELFSVCSVLAIGLLAVNVTGENGYGGLIGLSLANVAVSMKGVAIPW